MAVIADRPENVKPEDIQVISTTWAHGALISGRVPESNPRVDLETEVIVVVVHAEITSNELPSDVEPTTYDSYVIVYQAESGQGLGICYGCPSDEDPAHPSTTQPADGD